VTQSRFNPEFTRKRFNIAKTDQNPVLSTLPAELAKGLPYHLSSFAVKKTKLDLKIHIIDAGGMNLCE
jgi:hypothetical protein